MQQIQIQILQEWDRYLKASPFGYRVDGVGLLLNRYGVRPNIQQAGRPDLRQYGLEQLILSSDVMQAVADHIQVLEAGRCLYELIEQLFQQRAAQRMSCPSPLRENLLIQAVGPPTNRPNRTANALWDWAGCCCGLG